MQFPASILIHHQLEKRAGRPNNTTNNRLLRISRLLAEMLPSPLRDGIGCQLMLRTRQLSLERVRIIQTFMARQRVLPPNGGRYIFFEA